MAGHDIGVALDDDRLLLLGDLAAAEVDPRWWRAYGDPVLDSLMERALAGNLSAGGAVSRIAESRARERAAAAAGLPSVKAGGGVTREKIGTASLLATGGALLPTGLGPIGDLIKPIDLYDADFDASWELDLFGKTRRAVEQARAQTQEQMEARNDALVSLQAEVARTYFQLRANQALLIAAQAADKAQGQILDLTRRQREQGVVTDLDVNKALGRQTQTRTQTPQFQKAASQAMNSLAVLIGQRPGALDAELSVAAPLPSAPGTIAVSLPSTLARRRPDIRKAEASLHAATAKIGVAIAQLYPSVTLNGEVGQQALTASSLTDWSSNFYHFGPSVSLPIFQGGRLRANVRLARAEQATAALAYRQTVLSALQDVENSLVALRTDRQRQDSLDQAADIAARQLSLTRDRQKSGVATLIDVFDSETSLQTAQQEAIRGRLQVVLDAAALSKAVGGGWQVEGASTPMAQAGSTRVASSAVSAP